MNLMQLPDEYQNDPQGRDKWHRSHKEEEAKQKIFSVNSYFYQLFLIFLVINNFLIFEKKIKALKIRTEINKENSRNIWKDFELKRFPVKDYERNKSQKKQKGFGSCLESYEEIKRELESYEEILAWKQQRSGEITIKWHRRR